MTHQPPVGDPATTRPAGGDAAPGTAGDATDTPATEPDGLALELLVHGVGGTTPQDMLDDPRVVCVTGGETAGIYRRVADLDAESRPDDYRDEPVAEAYCWSNLTSGNSSRALWLLLLPFMVINLAHWARPAADRRVGTVRAHGVLVRLLALTLTVLLVAAACEVALDLTAWQCAGSERCLAQHSWLRFSSPRAGGWWSQPGRRLGLAALLPAALVALLWYLSSRTWSAYEAQPPTDGRADEGTPETADKPALCLPGFWYGRRIVARLRAAHTAAGFLTVAAALVLATSRYDRASGDGAVLDVTGWALLGLLGVGAAVCLHVVCRRGRTENQLDHTLDRMTVRWLPQAALALLTLAVVYAGWSRPHWRSTGMLPGDRAFGVVVLVQGGLVVAMAVAAVALYRATPLHRTPLWGLGGASVAVLACALGGVMSGGVAQRVADWLDADAAPGMGGGAIDGPPVVLTWMAAAIPPMLLVASLVVLALALRTWRRRGRLTTTVPKEYPDESADPARARKVAGVMARARLTDSVPVVVGPTALAMLLLTGGSVMASWHTGEVPGRAADGLPTVLRAGAETAQSIGSWLLGAAFVLLVTWARRAYRDKSARRTVGILWDVGTFWPRAAHPFAPPCYAERAVPDLTWRMRSWTARTGGRLVISGHSQGSVLAAAAVWQLDRTTRRRVALLTYGSPLERLYGRWFPAYFGPDQLRALHGDVHRWRNLWRHTDPIGGPIRLPDRDARPAVDCPAFKDPLALGRTAEHPLPAPIHAHSDYQADPRFARERAALLARLPEEAPGGRGHPEPSGTAAHGAATVTANPADPPDTAG